MKNTLKIDFSKREIIMDRTFAQYCQNTSSKEYAQLQSVRRDYPEFAVITRQIKRNPNKETYAGLTYQYMEDYILTHEDNENAVLVLAEFHELRLISRCHSAARRYPVIKQWFLAKYPNIEEFSKTTIQRETKPAMMQEAAA